MIPRKGDPTPKPTAPGVIRPEEIYARDELLGRMRWTESAARSAKRQGLKMVRIGKRDYILGQDLIDFVASQGGRATSPVLDN